MQKCIYAYTPVESNPPYLSINAQDDGSITMTVRSRLGVDNGEQSIALIEMPVADLLEMTAAVNTHCFPLQITGRNK